MKVIIELDKSSGGKVKPFMELSDEEFIIDSSCSEMSPKHVNPIRSPKKVRCLCLIVRNYFYQYIFQKPNLLLCASHPVTESHSFLFPHIDVFLLHRVEHQFQQKTQAVL